MFNLKREGSTTPPHTIATATITTTTIMSNNWRTKTAKMKKRNNTKLTWIQMQQTHVHNSIQNYIFSFVPHRSLSSHILPLCLEDVGKNGAYNSHSPTTTKKKKIYYGGAWEGRE